MKLVLTDSRKVGQFACILRHLKNVSCDIEIMVTEDGLYTQGMDMSHACLFELNLNKDWFGEFEADEGPYHLGINCEVIFKILNCLDDDQNIELVYDGDDYLYITLYSRDGEQGIRKEFQLPLMSLDVELMKIPKVEYSADIQMVSSEFSELIGQLSIFGHNMQINCSEDCIKMTGKGEMGQMNAIIKEEDIIMYAIEEDTVLDLTYAMDYLSQISSFSKVNKKINIHVSKNLPMKIQYDMDDVMDEKDDDEDNDAVNYIRFFLAPKFEDS